MLPLEFRSPGPDLVAMNIDGRRKFALYIELNVLNASREVLTRRLV